MLRNQKPDEGQRDVQVSVGAAEHPRQPVLDLRGADQQSPVHWDGRIVCWRGLCSPRSSTKGGFRIKSHFGLLGSQDHHSCTVPLPHDDRAPLESHIIHVEPWVLLVTGQLQARLGSGAKDIVSGNQNGRIQPSTLPANCCWWLIDHTALSTVTAYSAPKNNSDKQR